MKSAMLLFLGFFWGLAVHVLYVETRVPDQILTVEQMEMFLGTYACGSDEALSDADVRLLKQGFGYQEDQVEVISEGNGCLFDYAVGENSYLMGKGTILRDSYRQIKEVVFLSQLDAQVVSRHTPTFRFVLFEENDTTILLNTFDFSLYRVVDAQLPLSLIRIEIRGEQK